MKLRFIFDKYVHPLGLESIPEDILENVLDIVSSLIENA